MPTQVRIHPTAKTAAYTLACAFLVVALIVGAKHALHRAAESSAASANGISVGLATPYEPHAGRVDDWPKPNAILADVMVPTIDLRVLDATLEANWSAALASVLAGRTEVPVEGGRVDVLTENYAIEVDRWEKWHEAIGQAAHYSLKTNKVAVAAIMVPSDLWPISEATKTRLLLMDETCIKQEVKLVLLHRILDSPNSN